MLVTVRELTTRVFRLKKKIEMKIVYVALESAVATDNVQIPSYSFMRMKLISSTANSLINKIAAK